MYSVAFEYVDFNYELFMIKYFYYHIEKTKHVKEFKDYVLKLTYEYLLKYYTDKLELLQSGDQNYYQVDDKRSSKWKKTKEEYETKIKEYKRKLKGKSNKKKTFTIPLNNKYGELAAFLKKYQININIAVKNGVQGVKAHCVLASTDFKLAEYGIDEEALFYKGGHYMYITEVGKGRQIIVSSWGNKYIFNGSGAKEVKRVLINNTTKK